MKLLLDEMMPRKLMRHFPEHLMVDHVQLRGWGEIQNGALLRLAAADGFDALISVDRKMEYQQNAAVLPLSVVVLRVVKLRLDTLIPLVPRAIQALEQVQEPTFIRVDG